jgi:hypothetical protein
MKSAGALLALVIVLAVGYFIYKSQFQQGATGGAPPKEVIDVVGVKNDLLAIGQAERVYLANHGSYASIDQLQTDGSLNFSGTNRRGYNYVAETDDGQHFQVRATPSDPAKSAWPTLSIDENMQITQQ